MTNFKNDFELKICIWDWKSYNQGISNWRWFEFDELEEIPNHLEKLKKKGLEEPFICDYEFSHELPICDYTNISSVLKLVNSLDEIEETIEERIIENDIYSMDNFNDLLSGMKPSDIAKMIRYGSYNPMHDYFTFDGCGDIETLSEYEYNGLISDIELEVLSEYL